MSTTTAAKRPYCLNCQHFYITHEPATPYGCRAMGFKSAQNPALVVFTNSGLHCQLFSAKDKNPPPAPKAPRSWRV